jgi:hypothetical protein
VSGCQGRRGLVAGLAGSRALRNACFSSKAGQFAHKERHPRPVARAQGTPRNRRARARCGRLSSPPARVIVSDTVRYRRPRASRPVRQGLDARQRQARRRARRGPPRGQLGRGGGLDGGRLYTHRPVRARRPFPYRGRASPAGPSRRVNALHPRAFVEASRAPARALGAGTPPPRARWWGLARESRAVTAGHARDRGGGAPCEPLCALDGGAARARRGELPRDGPRGSAVARCRPVSPRGASGLDVATHNPRFWRSLSAPTAPATARVSAGFVSAVEILLLHAQT